MDLVGKKLGQYQIIEELGRGGMAVVYRAYQPSLNRYVAIKVLPPQFTFDEEFVQRFRREARSAAALHHPNIVTIYDINEQDGLYFIVMEFLEGKTLDRLLAETGRMPLSRIEHIISQVVDALEHAHQRGLIHRDIKPTNIIVDEQQNDHVTLMDFGLVRAAAGSGLTKTGVIVGTPEYMSPEQADGKEVDGRTDVYSLGVVLFKMLTGRVPFSRSTPHAVLIAHMTQEPPSISSISPGLPAPVEAVVRKALTKDREKRYARVSDLGRDLAVATSGEMPRGLKSPSRPKATPTPAPTRRAPKPDVGPKPAKKPLVEGWMWAVGGVGALLLLGLCGVMAFVLEIFPFAASATSTPTVAPTSTLAATQGVEVAATSTPTPSPTSRPSPTSQPSPSPSPRPSATAEATASSTPESTSTDTPEPTVTSASTVTPQETTPPQATTPQRMAPSQGGAFKNPIEFQWSGSLGAGQSYLVTAYHVESGHTVQSEMLTAQSWSVRLPEDKISEWRWYVAVIQEGSTVAQSDEGMFWFDPFGGAGGDDGGGGDGGGGGGDGGGGDGGDGGGDEPPPTYTPEPP
jgi:serine/threonine-protein kinase